MLRPAERPGLDLGRDNSLDWTLVVTAKFKLKAPAVSAGAFLLSNRHQRREKRIGTVRSSLACGMLGGNGGIGWARSTIDITSLSSSR